MCQTEGESYSHPIYKNDPLLYKGYVGKEIKMELENGEAASGFVYTVDPVSESFVLLKDNSLRIVFGHAIKSMEILSTEIQNLPELFKNEPNIMDQKLLEERKVAVKEMLLKNRFNVTDENGILTVEDLLVINPPYLPESCVSTNSTVLVRIQKLLSN